MRSYRSSLLLALLALASTCMLHATQTGLLTCGSSAPIKVSYFDLSAAPATAPAGTPGALSVHAALQQFGELYTIIGAQNSTCTLTHNSLTYTLTNVTLTNLDAIAGAASTGSAGAATYVHAVFQVAGISVTGGNDGDSGGDDGGWNRVGNTGWSQVNNSSPLGTGAIQ